MSEFIESEESKELQIRAMPDLKDLDERERKAVEMKYFGQTYGAIAKEIGYHEGSVGKLFMTAGRLTKAYGQFAALHRVKAQNTADQALTLAKAEALNAIERIIHLSQNAKTEGGIFKANEFLLQISGVTESVVLRSFLHTKTFEQAQRIMDDLFKSIYGRGLSIVVQSPTIMKDGKEAHFFIGSQYQPKQIDS